MYVGERGTGWLEGPPLVANVRIQNNSFKDIYGQGAGRGDPIVVWPSTTANVVVRQNKCEDAGGTKIPCGGGSAETTAGGTGSGRRVSFWYGPASYGGGDINATLALLARNRNAVTNVFVYCGHSVDATGLAYDPKQVRTHEAEVAAAARTRARTHRSSNDLKQGAFCLDTGLMKGIAALGIAPEIVVNSGSSNVTDYRAFFKNASANIAALAADGARFGARGISFDLEPAKGEPASSAADAGLFAAFLSQARPVFTAHGMRTTVAVAEWCAMTKEYATLAAACDRLLDMETYNADSMSGWLQGSQYGGYYEKFVAGAGVEKAAPGLGGWNASCGNHSCWSTTAASGKERMDRVAADGLEEVAMFRIVQQEGAQKMPEEWWWPLLADFLNH
jgi:hypothetical protein